MARKLGLIDRHVFDTKHPRLTCLHPITIKWCFYRSGFDKAVAVIVDGAELLFNQQ